MYGSNQCGSRSPKSCHQPGLPASRARLSRLSRSAVSVTPYRVSRSSTSRSLKPTRPCSIRLILEWEPRMASDALIATPRSLTHSNAWSSFARDLGIAKSACHILTCLFVTGQLSSSLAEPVSRVRHNGCYHALTLIRLHGRRGRQFGLRRRICGHLTGASEVRTGSGQHIVELPVLGALEEGRDLGPGVEQGRPGREA